MERLIDTAAREMGIDRVELRRRNHIAPGQMPYKAPSGMNYDFGEFTTVLDKALAAADWQGFDKRKAESAARGKLRGRGIGSVSRGHRPAEQGVWRHPLRGRRHHHHADAARSTTARATPRRSPRCWAASSASRSTRFRLLQGDSDQLKVGGGTGGSKSALVAQPGLPRGRRQADRAGQADRRPRARSRGRRHRVRARPLHHRRHRPRHRHPRAGRQAARRAEAAARRAAVARRQPHLGQSAVLVSQRLPRRRGRDRPRHRPRSRWCATSWSTTSARSSIRCWSRARRMAAWCRASARR